MEALRKWIRGLVGFRSPAYVAISSLVFVLSCLAHGRSGLRLMLMRTGDGTGQWLKFRRLAHPIYVRSGTDDVHSIVNNILREEYGQLASDFSPATIVDAGAYIGDTTAYFASRYGYSRCIALEPNPESYYLAKKNLEAYADRVELMPKALWLSEDPVRMGGSQTGAALSDDGFTVDATSIPSLLSHLGVARLGLVKMDIEGAELEVLKSGFGNWLRLIDVLLLETHGPEIEREVVPLLERDGFRVRRYRNVWYCVQTRSFESAVPTPL